MNRQRVKERENGPTFAFRTCLLPRITPDRSLVTPDRFEFSNICSPIHRVKRIPRPSTTSIHNHRMAHGRLAVSSLPAFASAPPQIKVRNTTVRVTSGTSEKVMLVRKDRKKEKTTLQSSFFRIYRVDGPRSLNSASKKRKRRTPQNGQSLKISYRPSRTHGTPSHTLPTRPNGTTMYIRMPMGT